MHQTSDSALEHRVGVGRVVPRTTVRVKSGAHLLEEGDPHIAAWRVLDLDELIEVPAAQRRLIVVVEAIGEEGLRWVVDGGGPEDGCRGERVGGLGDVTAEGLAVGA